jgi:hypothetical protein
MLTEKELSKMKKDELIQVILNKESEYQALETAHNDLKKEIELKNKKQEKQTSLNYFALLKIIENNTTTRLAYGTENNTSFISSRSDDRTKRFNIIIKDGVIVSIYNNLIPANKIKVIYNAWLNKLTIKK